MPLKQHSFFNIFRFFLFLAICYMIKYLILYFRRKVIKTMLYFISDTHFNHDKDFIYKPRGFNSIEESNNTIISNWNNIVTDEDEVYVLGDFILGDDEDFIRHTVLNLNGKINLVLGNHDTEKKVRLYNLLGITTKHADMIKIDKHNTFYLCHYLIIVTTFTGRKRKTKALFGHTHSKDKFYEDNPFMYNVTCDAHNCTPVSVDTIKQNILDKFEEETKKLKIN